MKIGTYKIKRNYKRKNKYNKLYAGKLTKKQKNINENRAIMTIAVVCLFAITYAFIMTSNEIHIRGGSMVEAKAETVKQAQPQVAERVQDLPVALSVNEVEQQIRKEIKKYDWKRITPEKAIEIVRCESSFRNVKNKHSSASGFWQFTNGTFSDGCRWRGLDWTLNDRYDIARATNMAHYFIEIRGEVERWECYKLI